MQHNLKNQIPTERHFVCLKNINRPKMDKPLDSSDFDELEKNLKVAVEEDKKYWRVNEVKCDAVHTAKTYEEFSDRVAAAHLKPLQKGDAIGKKTVTQWNRVAK